MVCRKFTSPFAVLVLIALVSLEKLIVANAQQAMVSHCGLDCGVEVANQELGDDRTSKATSAATSRQLRGRKLGAKKMNAEKKEEETSLTTSTNTGAAPSDGKFEHGGNRKLNLEMRSRNVRCRTKLGGLIPLSSDYKAPKTHPSKNN